LFKEKRLLHEGFWSTCGPYSDIVLSSRVRLVRNMQSVKFPNSFTSDEYQVIRSCLDAFSGQSEFKDNVIIDLDDIDAIEKRYLRERNVITYEMEISENSSVLVNEAEDFAILTNDEDHFRIQVIRPGLQLMEAYRMADRVDDQLNRFVSYSFSPELGYHSSCPSNLGTGMKVSALLHLPAHAHKKRIPFLVGRVKQSGMEMTGSMNDGHKSLGAIYQISNKVSLGMSEVDIIETLDGVINKILEFEDILRDEYISESRLEVDDMVWRSFGILKYSRKINYVEAMEHLSNIRLGLILALIKNIKIGFINNLMVQIQWSHLQKSYGKTLRNNNEIDEIRADYLRINLTEMECGNV